MTISQILAVKPKKMNSADKLSAIKGIVKSARKQYGNSGQKVPKPSVNGCSGVTSIEFLSDDDKLALIGQSIVDIRVTAIESVACNSALVFEQEVLRLVASDPILVHCTKPSKQSSII